MEEIVTYTIENCAQCGQTHPVTFRKLKNPIDAGEIIFDMWGLCPVNVEPLVMFWVEETKPESDDTVSS